MRENGKRDSVAAEQPVRESMAGNERGRKRRYKGAAGGAMKMCLARASVTPCGAQAGEEDGSAVKTRTGM